MMYTELKIAAVTEYRSVQTVRLCRGKRNNPHSSVDCFIAPGIIRAATCFSGTFSTVEISKHQNVVHNDLVLVQAVRHERLPQTGPNRQVQARKQRCPQFVGYILSLRSNEIARCTAVRYSGQGVRKDRVFIQPCCRSRRYNLRRQRFFLSHVPGEGLGEQQQ